MVGVGGACWEGPRRPRWAAAKGGSPCEATQREGQAQRIERVSSELRDGGLEAGSAAKAKALMTVAMEINKRSKSCP